MADIVRAQASSVPPGMQSRYHDMLDGTHALVIWAGGPGGMPIAGDLTIAEIEHLHVSGAVAVAGNTILVATPGAAGRLCVSAFLIQNESAVATTMILRSGLTANAWRALGQNQGDGFAMVFTLARPWKLNTNEALVLNLSGANQCNYSVMYYVEGV